MRKNTFMDVVKNFSYTLSSNLISLLISSIVIFIIPKLIGVEEFGYWQVYLFYSSYVGFLHFGWNDGIFLRYGGEKYDSLEKELFFSQFWMLAISQIFISLIIIFGSILIINNEKEWFIFNMVAINLIIVNIRYMLLYILQATNRMKNYSIVTILDRITYIGLICLIITSSLNRFEPMILADLIGKLISLIYAIYLCKDIVIRKYSDFQFSFGEAFENIRVGIKLMFANVASSLIIGVIKFGIQRVWSVAVFGKISLTLSISNLLMVFINALSLAIFPILRRTNQQKLPKIYATIRTILMTTLLGAIVIYYPLKTFLSNWLPQYAESLEYMALIFPMVIFEGKVALLTNTYLKNYRMESVILKINIITVITSVLSAMVITFYFKNLTLTILSIVVLLALRSILSEIALSKIIDISVLKDIILEVILSAGFSFIGWFIDSSKGILIYLLLYSFYLLIKKKEVVETYHTFKKLLAV